MTLVEWLALIALVLAFDVFTIFLSEKIRKRNKN